MSDPLLHIALYQPEIPQNTGNIGRLSLGLGLRLHLIEPLGFSLSEKAVRRAGLDYWSSVDLTVHRSFEQFLDWVGPRKLIPLSTKAQQSIANAAFDRDCVLLFGPETRGLPEDLRKQFGCYKIPMRSHIRSYNLSNSVAIASYFALNCLDPAWRAS